MDKTLLLGSKEIDEQIAREVAKQALYNLSPKYVVTDYSPGWNTTASMVASSTMGIQLYGAMPFDRELEGDSLSLRRKSRSVVVLKDFFEYINWINHYVDSVLVYSPNGLSSISQRVLLELEPTDIPVFRLSKDGL